MQIIIPNPQYVSKIKNIIREEGKDKLQIISDFDRTLTYAEINGRKTPSIIGMLRDGKHLTEEYAKKTQALFEKYNPIEQDQTISSHDRKEAMQNWWEEHYEILKYSNLKRDDLLDIVRNGEVQLRKGLDIFLHNLEKQNIPFIIFSSSGIGDAIKMYLEERGLALNNIHYLTNQFIWKNNIMIDVKQPIIHSFNKDETILETIPEIYNNIKDRKNVILLGDSIKDIGMVDGFEYNNLLKIGFLNGRDVKYQEQYEKSFDIILKGDGDLTEFKKITDEIIQ